MWKEEGSGIPSIAPKKECRITSSQAQFQGMFYVIWPLHATWTTAGGAEGPLPFLTKLLCELLKYLQVLAGHCWPRSKQHLLKVSHGDARRLDLHGVTQLLNTLS